MIIGGFYFTFYDIDDDIEIDIFVENCFVYRDYERSRQLFLNESYLVSLRMVLMRAMIAN